MQHSEEINTANQLSHVGRSPVPSAVEVAPPSLCCHMTNPRCEIFCDQPCRMDADGFPYIYRKELVSISPRKGADAMKTKSEFSGRYPKSIMSEVTEKVCVTCKGDPQSIGNFDLVAKGKPARRTVCRKCACIAAKEFRAKQRKMKREEKA